MRVELVNEKGVVYKTVRPPTGVVLIETDEVVIKLTKAEGFIEVTAAEEVWRLPSGHYVRAIADRKPVEPEILEGD
jgi:hypothetical protein